jgi:Rrf2 family protein
MHALSHTTGYAIVALGFIATADRPWLQAKTIAQATGIPKPYLSKILHALGKAGLLRTKRGAGGGVTLARPADQVTLLDVAQAVEPASNEPRCFLGMATCSDDRPCPMHTYWKAAREQTQQQLSQMTLARVAAHQQAVGFKAPPLEELLDDLPMPSRVYRAKPTGRFLRKFGVRRD